MAHPVKKMCDSHNLKCQRPQISYLLVYTINNVHGAMWQSSNSSRFVDKLITSKIMVAQQEQTPGSETQEAMVWMDFPPSDYHPTPKSRRINKRQKRLFVCVTIEIHSLTCYQRLGNQTPA